MTTPQPKRRRGRPPGKKYRRQWIFMTPAQVEALDALAAEEGYWQEAARKVLDAGIAALRKRS